MAIKVAETNIAASLIERESTLETERYTTIISDSFVAQPSGYACRELEG
jgi:hypothetical protein